MQICCCCTLEVQGPCHKAYLSKTVLQRWHAWARHLGSQLLFCNANGSRGAMTIPQLSICRRPLRCDKRKKNKEKGKRDPTTSSGAGHLILPEFEPDGTFLGQRRGSVVAPTTPRSTRSAPPQGLSSNGGTSRKHRERRQLATPQPLAHRVTRYRHQRGSQPLGPVV